MSIDLDKMINIAIQAVLKVGEAIIQVIVLKESFLKFYLVAESDATNETVAVGMIV